MASPHRANPAISIVFSSVRPLLFGMLLCMPLFALAADFSLQDMQGKTHRLSDYRGKWVLVNFWATWCPPCLREIPELNSLYRGRKDVVVIGVAMDYRSGKSVADFAKSNDIGYPVVLGSRKVLAQIGDIEVLPTSYLYSPAGEPVGSQEGEVTRQGIETYIREFN